MKLTVDNLLKLNHHMDYTTAKKLINWLNSTVLVSSIDRGIIMSSIFDTIKNREATFNPKKGNLLAYLRTSITLDLKSTHPTMLTTNLEGSKLNIPYHELDQATLEQDDIDLSNLRDDEILAIHRLMIGSPTNEDIDTVKRLQNV